MLIQESSTDQHASVSFLLHLATITFRAHLALTRQYPQHSTRTEGKVIAFVGDKTAFGQPHLVILP